MTRPHTPDELFARLDALAIKTTTVEHEAAFTVEQAKAHRGNLGGCHIKNLFLRNKKRSFWLVVAREDARLDLKALAKTLDAGRLSFGRPERLHEMLGVIPGAVTPFAVINDPDAKVKVVLDRAVLSSSAVQCHPLRNDHTTAIAPDDLLRFLRATGHEPTLLDL